MLMPTAPTYRLCFGSYRIAPKLRQFQLLLSFHHAQHPFYSVPTLSSLIHARHLFTLRIRHV